MTNPIRLTLTAVSLVVSLVVSLACLPAFAAEEADHERKLDEKDVPKAVLATMTKAAGTAKLSDYEAEFITGKEVFTASFVDVKTKVEMEVTVDPDGKLISVEKEDESAEEPKPAQPVTDAPKK